ncbi:hypothetical protein ACFL0Y_00995 [Patescibacteria group bacterium]
MAGKKDSCNEEQIKDWIEKGVKKLENMDCKDKKGIKKHAGSGAAGTIWFLGFIGAVVYFIQQATSFGAGLIGLFKALVWPAFLIYNLLEFLKI